MEQRAPLLQVSVIIPAYNAAAYLGGALASVQQQALTDLEILVVDDGSLDETRSVASAFAEEDPRIRVIAAERNGGPAAARNLGLARAKGEWIALLDADDAFEPDRLARLIGLARDCGADLLADNLILEPEEGRPERMLPLSEAASCAPVTAAEFLRGNLPDPERPRKSYGFLKPIVSRAFLQEHGLRYDESLRFAEDFAFYLACFAAGGRFFLCQQALYRYRIRADSVTAGHTAEDLRRLQGVDERLLSGGAMLPAEFRTALLQHKKSIDQRLQWRVLIDAAKARNWHGAVLAGFKGWHVFHYVSVQLAAEIWRRVSQKRLGSTPA